MMSRRRAILALPLVLALAAPAAAAELTGWAATAYAELAPGDTLLPEPLGHAIGFGTAIFTFEETGLADIVAATGAGTIQRGPHDLTWLCYNLPSTPIDMRVTFVSDHPVDGVADPLGLVALEPANPGADQAAGCTYLPEGTGLPALPTAGPGTFQADLATTFGDLAPDPAGRLVLSREDHYDGRVVLQQLRYHISADMADAVSISVMTLD